MTETNHRPSSPSTGHAATPPHQPDPDARANMSDDPGPVSPNQEDIAGQERHMPIPTPGERDEQYSGGRTGNV